jgi:hypothetical protein
MPGIPCPEGRIISVTYLQPFKEPLSLPTRSVSPAGARPIRASAPTGGDGGREVPAPRRSLRTGVGGMKPLSSAEPLPRRSTWRHPKVTPHVSPRARVNAARFPDPRPGRPPGCLWRGDAPRCVVAPHVRRNRWPCGHAMQFGVSPRGLAARGRCSLRSRTAWRHRIRRCRQVRSSFGRSRRKVQAEVRPPPPCLNGPWLVPGQGYEERAGKAAYRVLLPPGSRSCSSGFGRSASPCSPGLSPLQGFPPRCRGVAFTTRPLASVDPVAPEGGFEICSPGVRRRRGWLVSFGDCRPS